MFDVKYFLLILLVAFAGCSNDTQGIDSGTTDTETETEYGSTWGQALIHMGIHMGSTWGQALTLDT